MHAGKIGGNSLPEYITEFSLMCVCVYVFCFFLIIIIITSRALRCWSGGANDATVLPFWRHSQHCLSYGIHWAA